LGSRLLCLAVALLVLSTVSLAHSAYVLESGHGVAVCEGYRDNLNAANPKVPYGFPNLISRPIDPAFPDFQAVKWGEPEGTRFPVDAVVRFFWQRDANPVHYLIFPDQWLTWHGTSNDVQRAKRNYLRGIGDGVRGFAQEVSLRMTHVDIDNDGTPDAVVQFAQNLETQLLLVLKPSPTQIDDRKTRRILQHPAWGDKTSKVFRRQERDKPFNAMYAKLGLEPVEHALFGASYGIFLFQGKTYYDLWWLGDPEAARSTAPLPDAWRLRVFSANPEHASEVCKFRFEFL
jgi:hypothetical protein